MKKVITLSILSLLIFACSHKTATTTSVSSMKTSSATVSNERFMAGKAVYDAHCNKCHAYKDPRNYTLTKWTKWMDKMARKAKLSDDQKKMVVDFGSVNVKAN